MCGRFSLAADMEQLQALFHFVFLNRYRPVLTSRQAKRC